MDNEHKIPAISQVDIDKFQNYNSILEGKTPITDIFNNPEYQNFANQMVQDRIAESIKMPKQLNMKFENPIVKELKIQNELQTKQIQELTNVIKNLQDSKPKQFVKFVFGGIWFVIGVAVTYYFPVLIEFLKEMIK